MSHIVLPATASREEWLTARRGGIGGSDAAAACGLNPYTTPFQLWLEKTARCEPEFDEDAQRRMRWGHLLEPLLIERFDERHPEYVMVGGEGIYADDEHDWRLATVDALAMTPRRELAAVVDAKTGTHRQLPHWDENTVPLVYEIQVQWYLAILDAPLAYLIALLDTSTEIERVIERDDALMADVLELAAEFWEHVRTDTPPPADAHPDTARMLARRPARPGTVIDLEPAWTKAIARRAELADQISVLDAEKTRIDNELRAAMGDAEEARIGWNTVATFRAPAIPHRLCHWNQLKTAAPEAYAACVSERPAGRRLHYRTNTEQEET